MNTQTIHNTINHAPPSIRSIPPCPQCKSNNTYISTLDYACRTCGNRWTIKPYTPFRHIYVSENDDEIKDFHKGPCSNCGRDKAYYSTRNKLCWKCGVSVKGLKVGSDEYVGKLKEVWNRINSPDYKEYINRKKDF